MIKTTLSKLVEEGRSGKFFNASLAEILKYGHHDYEVVLDEKGEAYQYIDNMVTPLFQFYLAGSQFPYPNKKDVTGIIEDGLAIDIRFSLLKPKGFSEDEYTVKDNYYVHYKEDMWAGVTSSRRGRVKKLLNAPYTVKEMFLSLEDIYHLCYNYWQKYQVFGALHYFTMCKNDLVKDFHILGLYEGEKLLAFGCYSRNFEHDGIQGFGYNQFIAVDNTTPCAAAYVLHCGRWLAEKYGNLILDTTYTADFDQPSFYEYKKRIANLSLPTYGMLYASNDMGFTPPIARVD